jgi:VRR-NUC domain
MDPNQLPPPYEHEEQAALFQEVGYHLNEYPELIWLHSNPNGAALMRSNPKQRFSRQAQKLSEEGMKRGILDISLEVARGGYFGFWLEMKRKGEKLRKEQREFSAFLEEHGYFVGLAFSAEEAWKIIEAYMRMEPTKVRRT